MEYSAFFDDEAFFIYDSYDKSNADVLIISFEVCKCVRQVKKIRLELQTKRTLLNLIA